MLAVKPDHRIRLHRASVPLIGTSLQSISRSHFIFSQGTSSSRPCLSTSVPTSSCPSRPSDPATPRLCTTTPNRSSTYCRIPSHSPDQRDQTTAFAGAAVARIHFSILNIPRRNGEDLDPETCDFGLDWPGFIRPVLDSWPGRGHLTRRL